MRVKKIMKPICNIWVRVQLPHWKKKKGWDLKNCPRGGIMAAGAGRLNGLFHMKPKSRNPQRPHLPCLSDLRPPWRHRSAKCSSKSEDWAVVWRHGSWRLRVLPVNGHHLDLVLFLPTSSGYYSLLPSDRVSTHPLPPPPSSKTTT